MADTTVRITGPVVKLDHREGITGQGRPYSFYTARVLVGDLGLADVTLPDSMTASRGELVDWIVEVSVYAPQGREARLNLRAVEGYPADATAVVVPAEPSQSRPRSVA